MLGWCAVQFGTMLQRVDGTLGLVVPDSVKRNVGKGIGLGLDSVKSAGQEMLNVGTTIVRRGSGCDRSHLQQGHLHQGSVGCIGKPACGMHVQGFRKGNWTGSEGLPRLVKSIISSCLCSNDIQCSAMQLPSSANKRILMAVTTWLSV